ncbi:MAG: YncE family protein [Vicinamibacterales bacterium]
MTKWSVRLSLLALAALVLRAPVETAPARAAVSPGKGTLIVGTYPNTFWIIDEATQKITGTIPFTSGLPRRTTMPRDRTRFYTVDATMEKVEVIDIRARKTIDAFTLSTPTRHVRIRSLEADPLHRFVIMVTRTAEKAVDRFVISPSAILQYDLKEKKVVRTIPWPRNEERESANIQFSPDGKLMYLFSEQDVLIFETDSFTQVDTWELSQPIENGFGRLDFGSTDVANDEPGFYTAAFTVEDPVQHKRILGIGRVNLAAKSVEFFTLGPVSGTVSFTMAPGRKRAFGLRQEIGLYEFWNFDLEAKRLSARAEFKGRPRMSLKTSSNGQVLYIYNAGETIDLYDAATYKYLSTISLDGDMTTELFVFPPGTLNP